MPDCVQAAQYKAKLEALEEDERQLQMQSIKLTHQWLVGMEKMSAAHLGPSQQAPATTLDARPPVDDFEEDMRPVQLASRV